MDSTVHSTITHADGSAVSDACEHRLRLPPVPEDRAPRPRWSVMIPTYNCARYLRQTLESVLGQDPGAEIMQIEVIDDRSTKDDPEQVVREVGKGRVGFYRQEANVGHTRNFETCLQHARGRLVHLLHGDDAVRPGFYQRMGQAFDDHPQIGAAYCRTVCMDGQGNWTTLATGEISGSGVIEDLIERMATRCRIQTPSMVVRREVYETLGAFDRRLAWTEDWEMWTRVAAHYPVWYELEPLALYRVHTGSNTGRMLRTGENVRDIARFFGIVENYLPREQRRQLCSEGRKFYALDALKNARSLLGSRDLAGARAQMKGALGLSHDPEVIAATATLILWAGSRGLNALFKGDLRNHKTSQASLS